MNPTLVRVDAEALVVQFLRRQPVVTAITSRIATKVASSPSIRVWRLGGVSPSPRVIDKPRLQIECYGLTEAEAANLCGVVRAAMSAIVGVNPLGTVTQCDEVLGEQHLPDPVGTPGGQPRERYLFAVVLTVHPNT